MRRIARSGWTVAGVALSALAVNMFGGVNMASANLPSNKPFAAASKSVKVSPGTRVELLSATVKNSKPTDMMLHVSMECSIITDNVILGSATPGAQESAATEGTVRVWIEIDGLIVPVISSSAPPQTPPTVGGDESDKVTFCNRVFNRSVKDAEDPQDGYDNSRDYIETKSANAFNWVRLNMGSGSHTIKLFGDLSHFSTTGSTASAFIGNRSLVGVPDKFSNDAVINEVSTS